MFYILAAFIVGVVGIHVIQYRKDYFGTWNGHQIQIVYKYLSFDILVDNDVVIANAKHSELTLQHTFPLYGEQSIQIFPRKDSNSITVSIDLVIAEDVVPLIQAPQNFFGNTVQKQLPKLKSHSPARLGISDPRLQSAQNLHRNIKAEIGEDTEISKLLDRMMSELVNHLEIAERIESSEDDYAVLGGNQDGIAEAKEQNNKRIELLLTGLQDIHLTILQRNVLSRDSLEEDLMTILARLDTQIEMDRRRV